MNIASEFDKEHQLNEMKKFLVQSKFPAEREAYFIEYSNLKFEKNLKAFLPLFPEIYGKYLTYQPSDKFRLFPNTNGTANILDYDSLVPMYSEDPIAQCLNQVAKNIENPIIGMTDHSSVEKIENVSDFIHVDLMKNIGAVYNEAKINLAVSKKLGTSIPSIMIFGVGLGYHILDIVKTARAGFVNLFEPNEDYFFASLFTADWAEILKLLNDNGSFIYLGIGLSESEVYEEFYSRTRQVSIASVCNSWFFQHYPSIDVNRWISQFKEKYHQFFTGFGFFDDALIGLAHTLQNIQNNIPILVSEGSDDSIIRDFPVFIIANGPSLDAEIEYIKSVKEKVIILSCNSATTALIKHDIIPDFHVALERTEVTYHFLKEKIPEALRSKINLLTVNVMHPKVSPLFGWAGIALKPGEIGTQVVQIAHYIKNKKLINALGFCNPLVGNTALSFACHLGFKNIYLFGVDNGYLDNQYHHSKSSYYYDDKGNNLFKTFRIGKDFKVPGNFEEYVLTEQFMYVGNVQMGRLLKSYKNSKVHCYNCSNGAKIEHSIPLPSSNIILNEQSDLDKSKLINYIKNEKFSKSVSFDEVSAHIDTKKFGLFCKTLSEILSQDATDREQCLLILLESIRYLNSFKKSATDAAIYLLMEGETLYVTTILISLLFNFGDDFDIHYYKKALNFWIDFVINAPKFYEENYNKPK